MKKTLISSERLEKFKWNFQEKKGLMIILKVTKNQGFTLSQENTVSEKPQGW